MMVLATAPRKGVVAQTLRTILSQPLVIGILCGFAVNLLNIALPKYATTAIEMIARAGIPAALFGLGGVLHRYRIAGDMGLIALVTTAALIVHPAIAYTLGRAVFQLDTNALRSVTITAAMAPGVNAYLFAHLFGVGQRIGASAVLIGTAASIFTTWGWLHILP
jgi:predicted permease